MAEVRKNPAERPELRPAAPHQGGPLGSSGAAPGEPVVRPPATETDTVAARPAVPPRAASDREPAGDATPADSPRAGETPADPAVTSTGPAESGAGSSGAASGRAVDAKKSTPADGGLKPVDHASGASTPADAASGPGKTTDATGGDAEPAGAGIGVPTLAEATGRDAKSPDAAGGATKPTDAAGGATKPTDAADGASKPSGATGGAAKATDVAGSGPKPADATGGEDRGTKTGAAEAGKPADPAAKEPDETGKSQKGPDAAGKTDDAAGGAGKSEKAAGGAGKSEKAAGEAGKIEKAAGEAGKGPGDAGKGAAGAKPAGKARAERRRVRPGQVAKRAVHGTAAWAKGPTGRMVLPGAVLAALVALAVTSGAYLVPKALEAAPAPSSTPAFGTTDGASVPPAVWASPGGVPGAGTGSLPPSFPVPGVSTGLPAVSNTRPADALAGWASQIGTRVSIPVVAVQAYVYAELVTAQTTPGCHLNWTTLAAIGEVESSHGSVNGAVLGADGVALPAILGLPLDGQGGRQLIADTDQGVMDLDKTYDRAMGPMQFIPSSWKETAVDADRDGILNPNDIDDASLTAAVYLCKNGRDMARAESWWDAILSYNAVRPYAEKVFRVADDYGRRSKA